MKDENYQKTEARRLGKWHVFVKEERLRYALMDAMRLMLAGIRVK